MLGAAGACTRCRSVRKSGTWRGRRRIDGSSQAGPPDERGAAKVSALQTAQNAGYRPRPSSLSPHGTLILAYVHDHPLTDSAPLGVEVHFDFLCPWCLIGKRQLDAAARRFEALVPGARVAVTWRSHELLPDTPPDGLDYESFYIHRLGSPEAVALRRMQVREAGLAAGVRFEFDRIRRLPNTARAHALLAQAQAQGVPGLASRLVERVLTAYFLEGEDIGAPAVLERLGRDCGLPEAAFEAAESVARAMHAGAARPAGPGTGAVPFFVFDRTHALSGAGSVAALLEALLDTWQGSATRRPMNAGSGLKA